MNEPLLVLDVHYLCHRAFHTMKELSWKGKATGVVFGFLKSLTSLKDEFQTDRVAFCFEHPHLFRSDLYPAYKMKRAKNRTPEEILSDQIFQLYKNLLPMIGFKNIFCFYGMESDDIMAQIAEDTKEDDETILVTADSDLFQCLRENVSIYSPQKQKMLTKRWFKMKYGIPPYLWWKVKAIAGCATDEVKGIPGVGEVTALKYLKDETSPKTFLKILSDEGQRIVRHNKLLVKLPHPNCPKPFFREDKISVKGWKEVCGLLGMRSLAGHPPISTRSRV